MPHSSGGGSHSGGSYGGGGSSGGGGPRISEKPFEGARQFRYYNRYGEQRYIYSEVMPRPKSVGSLVRELIIMVPFVVLGIFIFTFSLQELFPPEKLSSLNDGSIIVSDTAGVIDNDSELMTTLREFEHMTGISPAVMTVYDSEWKSNYDSLEIYAYDLYVNAFDDEQHWLIVYSEPENAEELDFVDWSWQGMQGNDTDSIITEEKADSFRELLQKELVRESGSVGEAINDAFADSLGYIMEPNLDIGGFAIVMLFAVLWNVFVVFVIVAEIKAFRISRFKYVEV